jgi:hypothetical protein
VQFEGAKGGFGEIKKAPKKKRKSGPQKKRNHQKI